MHRAFKDVREFMILAQQQAPEKLADEMPPVSLQSVDVLQLWLDATALAVRRLQDDDSVSALRARLALEETRETIDAMLRGDMLDLADGLVDICYVVIGWAVTFGIPLGSVWDAVHRANMRKGHPCPEEGVSDHTHCPTCLGTERVMKKDGQGKVIKPRDWREPDIADAVMRPRPPRYPALYALVTTHYEPGEQGSADWRSKPISFRSFPLNPPAPMPELPPCSMLRDVYTSRSDADEGARDLAQHLANDTWRTWYAAWQRRMGIFE